MRVPQGFSPLEPLPFRWGLVLAALSALLLHLSFPHARQAWLAWVALVPFLAACRGQGFRRGALLGLVLGIGFQAGLLSWAQRFGPLALVGLVLLKSLAPALAGGILGLGLGRERRPWQRSLFSAATWVAMEFLQTLGPLGITWGMLGHSQARVPVLIQVGALVGPWGLSFVLAMVNAAVAEWALALSGRGSRREPAVALAWSAALAGLVLLYGTWRMAHPPTPSAEPLAWGVVQVSMPQDVKWDPQFQESILGRLEALSAEAARGGARVVVWPETAIPYRGFLESPHLVNRIGDLARGLGVWLLVGSIESAPGAGTYNTASLFAPDGRLVGRHDKHRLVPFGEFLPGKRYWPPLPQLALVMNYLPGPPPKPLEMESTGFGVLICYESMVSHLARNLVRQGAGFLVIPTNDAWFDRSSAAAHHFDMAIMRAVETGRPTIQAGNTGISGFVTATGQVLAESRLFEQRVLVARLAPVSEATLYTRLGDMLAWVCLAGTALGLVRKGLAREATLAA